MQGTLCMLLALPMLTGCSSNASSEKLPAQEYVKPAAESVLELEVYVSEPAEVNVTSVLIMGPTEMVVVCAQATKSSVNRLADLIEEKGRTLKYIFLTHPHFDHHLGGRILKERFPEARYVASPEVARLQQVRTGYDDQFAQQNLGENAVVPSIPVEPYADSTFTIDGETIELWKGVIGDAGFGHPDEPHVALYVPGLNALLPSDAVYFDAHVFMGGSSVESRKAWVAQLDRWLERDFDVVVPGHMPRVSLPELTGKAALQHTRDYILAYDSTLAQVSSSDTLIARMIAQFPNIKHQQGIFLSAFFDFYEFRTIVYDENGRAMASPGPKDASEAAAQKAQYEALRSAYNPVGEAN
ncbi:MAG: MBL fold metallo-hydrolase [Bacteroidota bacterium]